MAIKFKKLRQEAVMPWPASEGAAGYDLSLCESIDLEPWEKKKVGAGVAVEIPVGYVGEVHIRSSVGWKYDVVLANQTGIIDADYRGEIMLPLRNVGNRTQHFEAGERVAQLVIVPCLMEAVLQVDELSETERGAGGFGSTGR